MRLFFTDRDFVWKGMPRPGIPFLCNREMEFVKAPNLYLRYIAIVKGRTRSPKTWMTYGHHLYEFFAFVEENNLRWDQMSLAEIAAWRDSMLERNCARNTVNQRLRCVNAFYLWALRQGKVDAVPFSTQDVWVAKSLGFFAHLDASGGRYEANELTVPTYQPLPKLLHMDKAIRFLEAMSPRRLKLMGYLALLTGMRRWEIAGLDYRVVPNPAGNNPEKQLPMILNAALTPTKGSKTRTVMLPFDLAVALWEYFQRDWPKLYANFKRRHQGETTRFFLSTVGDELSVRHLNNAFSRVSTKIGIKCNPHMLRHTFGTYELLRMMRRTTKDFALMWVRDRMGHSSILTTEQYIHAVDLIQHDDIDGFQLEVCEALRRGD